MGFLTGSYHSHKPKVTYLKHYSISLLCGPNSFDENRFKQSTVLHMHGIVRVRKTVTGIQCIPINIGRMDAGERLTLRREKLLQCILYLSETGSQACGRTL